VDRALALAVLVALAAPAGAIAGGKGEFLASCRLDHRAAADPIVHPGHRRAGHLHDFFGNVTTSGRSTSASLRRGRTTCAPRADRSAYWVPTLFDRGRALRLREITVYYAAEEALAPRVRPFPRDLRMIARGHHTWSCLGGGPSGRAAPRCPAGHDLELLLDFPDCWDGRRSDARDHRSHMAYSAGGACPASHPVPVPQIEFKLRWPTRGGQGISLASGRTTTAHGDFMNGWSTQGLQRRIDTCLKAVVKCGADGRPA